ncbi:MAG TPA: oligosaccharide flippase family protein [Thermoanaerobaculaceae bacterium]|nr:oligosaccharide flippase family protein [Thermoanaerobaculaceae bacterium]
MNRVAVRLARNVAWLGAGEVVLKGAMFAAGVMVARGLGPAAMGAFTVAYGAAMMLMLVLTAGQVEVVIRETARQPDAARGVSRLSREWQRRVALAAIPVALVAAALVPDRVLRFTLLTFIPYTWLRSALISRGAVFKGLDRMEVEVAGRTAELAVALTVLALLTKISAPVWVTGLAFTVGAAAGLLVVVRALHRLPLGATPAVTRSYLAREGAVFVVLNLGLQAMLRVDTFMLAGFGFPKEQIGQYGVAVAPVWGLLGVAQLVAVAAYPTLAKAATAGRLRTSGVLAIACAGAAIGTTLATALTLVKALLVRIVFGPQYLGSVRLMAVLAWALPGACVGMLMGVLIAASGRQRWGLGTQSVTLILAVAGNAFAIPRWGLIGAAGVAVAVWSASTVVAMTLATLAVRNPRRVGEAVPAGLDVE